MRIPRFYHPDALAADTSVELSKDAGHHLANVLRMKPGQPIVLFNGDNNEYAATLEVVEKRKVIALVETKLGLSVESPLSIHLGQGISKGERMDFVLQKSVELGVSEITPLITERCSVKLNQERWQKKHEQWQKIIISACEQSGRNQLPQLHPPVALNEWLNASTEQLRLTLDPKAEQGFNRMPPPPQGVRLLIGPEGGLSDNEVYYSKEKGFQGARLGPRILRTETAALTSISILQNLYGDLS